MAERRSLWELTTDIFGTGWPRVDMDETDEEIRITAELPGVDKDNIDVSVADERVTVRGEKKEHEEKKGKGILITSIAITQGFGDLSAFFIRSPEGIMMRTACCSGRRKGESF
jgi:HSP20 family molecular chaperone IbpA